LIYRASYKTPKSLHGDQAGEKPTMGAKWTGLRQIKGEDKKFNEGILPEDTVISFF
jgi:hypothetical protein